jgi:hypothetical protein
MSGNAMEVGVDQNTRKNLRVLRAYADRRGKPNSKVVQHIRA